MNTTETHRSAAFRQDVLKGLNSNPKYLDSKYFYDTAGDKLFQQIMSSPDYYLTDAELEIFNSRCRDMLEVLNHLPGGFDVIELGAGDALKSKHLLECLQQAGLNFSYYPVDISGNVISLVERELPKKVPGIKIKGIQAEYFDGLKQASVQSGKPKIVLFLGGNIGNMLPSDAEMFLVKLRDYLNENDLVFIGFDLKKNPWTIFNAYNDAEGITKAFNINLLRRINRELDADFKSDQFEHYESYDPESGTCKSYLISLCPQKVFIKDVEITFKENEYIFTEISQKYSVSEIDQLAERTGFKKIKHLFDSKKWFTDVIWQK